VWTDLPILALWIRKAVAAGARLVVLGPNNGLWRDTAARVPAIPVDKYDAMATDAVRAEYQNVIARGKDIHEALADARWLIEHRARR